MTSSWCGQKEKTIFKLSYIYINSIHPTIKFKHEFSNSSHQSLPFLDVQVHLDNSLIETDLHTEPTDKHQYLLKTSCHPAHTKRTIPFSLALRLRRICSTDDFFNKLCDKLINFLELRGYSRHFFKKEINQARFIPRYDTLRDCSIQQAYLPALQNGNHPHCLTFTSSKEKRRIHDPLNCKSRSLIYLTECKKSGKQYTGETKHHLHQRFGEYRRSILNYGHFSNPIPIS